jgi:hypothetical protein
MSLFTRKQTILAKIESSYGVDPTPTGAANAMLVGNLQYTPINAEQVNRIGVKGYLGNGDTLLTQLSTQVSFEIELAGAGAAGTAPAWGPLLRACGFSETIDTGVDVTYAPRSTGFESVTIYFNNDGILHKMLGARGTFELDVTVKQIPVLKFTFTGKYTAPADTAVPTCDFSDFQIPKIPSTANTTNFSLFSYAGALESLQLNLGGEVNYRTLIGDESVLFVDRKPSGIMVIEAPLLATKDFFAIAAAGTTGALALQHGQTAGNIVTLSAPRVSLGNIGYQDSEGVQMLSLPFVIAPDSGNDELEIVVK